MEIREKLCYTLNANYVNLIICNERLEAVALELEEKRLGGELKYHGVIVDVYRDRVLLPDGRETGREVVKHPGGVTILPIDDEGYCYMVRQFRYPAGRVMLEAPAGKLEYGEEHLACAERELSEETGFTADRLVYMGKFYTSPGFSTEILHIYLAFGLHPGKSHPDDGEFLNVEKMKLSELSELAMAGKIEDAKTVVAVLKAERYLAGRQ